MQRFSHIIYRYRFDCIAIAILFGILFWTFRGLTETFFQQDEWYTFARYLYLIQEKNFWQILSHLLSIESILSHVSPLSNLVLFPLFKLFGLSVAPYAIVSMLVHLVNASCVYVLAKRLLQSVPLAWISALLFGTNSIAHQAVTWPYASFATQWALLFTLIAILAYLKRGTSPLKRWSIVVLLAFFVAILFKESAFFLFLFFPLVAWFRRSNHTTLGFFLKQQWWIGAVALMAVLWRALAVLIPQAELPIFGPRTPGFDPILSEFRWGAILVDVFLLPLKSIVQLYIPPQGIYFLSDAWLKFFHPARVGDLYIQQEVVASFIQILLAFLLHGMVLSILWKQKRDRHPLFLPTFFSYSFMLLSIIPNAFIGTLRAFLESRHYYISSVGSALLLVSIGSWFLDMFSSRFRVRKGTWWRLMVPIVCWIAAVGLSVYHIEAIRRMIASQQETERVRRGIVLMILQQSYPLPPKVLLYTESDTMYYGQAEKIMPFQSGFGHTLMVYYVAEGQLPPSFLAENFLRTILDTGYREIDDRSFGYFRDYEELFQVVDTGRTDISNVYAFKWQGGQLYNITEEIREKLKTETERFVLKRGVIIQREIAMIDNKRFFPVDLTKGQNLYTQDSREVVVYRDGLEASYGGPYLHFTFQGDGKNEYVFHRSYNGYELGFVSRVIVNSSYEQPDIFLDGDKLRVIFSRPLFAQDSIDIMFGLNGKTIMYTPGKPFLSILESKNIVVRGDGGISYSVSLDDELKSLRHFWMSEKERYVPIGFVGGKMERIKSWDGFGTSRLAIELLKPLGVGETLTVPVLVVSHLTSDDRILWRYREKRE